MNVTRPRRRVGITTQTVLLASAIAAIAVLVAGVASAPFVRSAAETEARGALASLADLTAVYVDRRELQGPGDRGLPRPLERILREERVTGFIVTSDSALPPFIPSAQVDALLDGVAISFKGRGEDGVSLLVEGRPVLGGGVILVQPLAVAGEASSVFLVRIAGALALGLLIAIVIAYFAARRLSRPLRAAQSVAHRMAEGEREQFLQPQGPAEVAEIAEALNALNSALVVSEGRQREFLLSVSHELRTPLTAVKGYGEALADGVLPESEIPDVGGTVAREAERLHRLVNDLLDLARLGAVDFRFQVADIDASQVVLDAAAVWRDRCSREGVAFQVEGVGAPVRVLSDAMRLRQIIDNLAENALRVSPEGSQVAFAVHRDPAIAGPGYIAIEVRDGGPGLTPQDMDVAFEPGALHERYRGVRPVGTGLGLALVARLASGMGGTATVTSLPGEGTSFWVRIPTAAAQT